MSRNIFKKSKRTFIKDLRKEVIACCLLPKPNADKHRKTTNKISQNIWKTDPTGKLLQLMIEAIRKAKNIICVSSFLLNEKSLIEAMLDASNRGVRVYILTSELKIEEDLVDEDEISQKIREEHLKLLDKIAGKLLVRTAGHFHSKFIIIDPTDENNSIGFLLTANLKHKALLGTNELGVIIRGSPVYEFYELFCYAFWAESEHELLEPGRFRDVTGKEKINLPPLPTISFTTNKNTCLKQQILSIINNSKGELIISAYGFDDNYEIPDLILLQIQSGRKVIILAPPRPRIMNILKKFQEAGAEVFLNDYHHAKAILVRNNAHMEGFIFTANLTAKGLDNGFESGIVVSEDDLLELERILDEWINDFSFTLNTKVPIGDVMSKIRILENNSLIEKEVRPYLTVDLGEIEANSIFEIESAEPKSFPPPDPNEIGHEIRYEWTVIPPLLPNDAKRVKTDSELPLYEKKNQTYVLIKNEKELEIATQLSKTHHAKIVVEYKTFS